MCRSWDDEYSVLPLSAYEEIGACCKCRCHNTEKSNQFSQVDLDLLDSEIGDLCEVLLTESEASPPSLKTNRVSLLNKKRRLLSGNQKRAAKEPCSNKSDNAPAPKVTKKPQVIFLKPANLTIPNINLWNEESPAKSDENVNQKKECELPMSPGAESFGSAETEQDYDPDWKGDSELTLSESRHACDQCNKTFAFKKGLIRHKKNHSGLRPFQCTECGACFTTNSNMKDHENTHKGIKPFKCDQCDLSFVSNGILNRHRKKHSGEKPFQCPSCEFCTNSKSSLLSHEKIHTNDRPFPCDQCDLKFKLPHHLRRHKLLHSGAKPFLCSICGLRSKRLEQHVAHVKIHEQPQPNLKCEICGVTFKSESNLKDHHLDIHQGNNTILQCPECSKTFYKRSVYNKHLITHSKEKFQCEICGAQSQSKGGLKVHKLTHSVEKPFKCSFCTYSAKLKTAITQHERIHTGEKPHQCGTCGKSFRIKNHLKIHILTHIDARPFKCELCESTFRRPDALRLHRQTHSNERPFSCDECDSSFRSKRDLNKHKSLHLTNKPNRVNKGFVTNYETFIETEELPRVPAPPRIPVPPRLPAPQTYSVVYLGRQIRDANPGISSSSVIRSHIDYTM